MAHPDRSSVPPGLLFTATPGANPAGLQNVELFNPATHSSNYTAAVRFTNGSAWLTAPAASALAAGQRASASPSCRAPPRPPAGVYRATLTFTFTPENVTRALDIAFVVNAAAPPSAAAASAKSAAGVSCAAKQLVAVLRLALAPATRPPPVGPSPSKQPWWMIAARP